MPARVEMFNAAHIFRPNEVLRILRASNNEFAVWQLARWFQEKFLNLGLAICGVRSHVAQVAGKALVHIEPSVMLGIKRAVKGSRPRRAEARFQFAQDRATGKAEIHIEAWNLLSAKIIRLS